MIDNDEASAWKMDEDADLKELNADGGKHELK